MDRKWDLCHQKKPLGKIMVGKVPSDMATHLYIDELKKFTLHSYRWSAASAVADAGATSDQMHMVGKMPKWTRNINPPAKQPFSRSKKHQDAETKDNLGHVNVAEKACKETHSLPTRVQRSPKRVRLATLGNSGILWDDRNPTCMPIPLAPDPIRVQSCVCCLSEPIEIVWR